MPTKGQGIYFSGTGALFLVLNPSSGTPSFDHTLVLPNNVSYTTSDLWDMQVDSSKFPTNPFSLNHKQTPFLNASEIQGAPEDVYKIVFGSCTYVLVAQLQPTSVSLNTKRIWKYGRVMPFEASEDDVSVSDLDEERMVYSMSGYLASPNCGIMLEMKNDTRSIDFDRLVSSGHYYIFFVVLNTVCLSLLTIWHVESHETNSMMMKLSAMSFLAPTCFDVICSLFHLLMGFSFAPLSRPLYFIFFLSFSVYTFFQVRYILEVCKLTWYPTSSTGNLARIYTIIYGYIGFSLVILILSEEYSWAPLLFAHSGWIFQVVHNALNRTKNAYNWRYVLGSTACRFFIPFYFYCLPQQLILIPFRPGRIALLMLFALLSILVLFAQDTFGPRFFIPKWLLPAAYNYHRPIPQELIHQAAHDGHNTGIVCAICMTEVNAFNTEHMIAPCNHVFHEACLLRWMDQKMECPICRGRLPLPPELDQDEAHDHPAPRPNAPDMV